MVRRRIELMKKLFEGITAVVLFVTLAASGGETSIRVDEEEVVFRLELEGIEKVYLVGDFNGWNPTMDRLVKEDDGFEIRLYLLPGMYRYRFVVDGVSIPDPDNPYLDEEGNSYFIFREIEGKFEIVFTEVGGERDTAQEEVELSSSLFATFDAEERAAFFHGTAVGTINGRAEADLSVGHEFDAPKNEIKRGRAFFLRGSAGYKFEKGTLRAFSRAGNLSLDDPLSIFGDIGPFRYPIGLFCRGALYEGRLPFGIEGRLFFGGRISGYTTGLEREPSSPQATDLFSERDLTDSDLIGLKVGSKLGRIRFYYLYRYDRRPRRNPWRLTEGDGVEYRGLERVCMEGLWLSLRGSKPVVLEIEFLSGRSFLSAQERTHPESLEPEPFEFERKWERGTRFYTGVAFHGEKLQFRLSTSRTTIEGERALREGRPDGSRVILDGMFGYTYFPVHCSVEGTLEHYSVLNTGEVFWIQRRNFWLDGDELTIGHLPFLAARDIYKVRMNLTLGEKTAGEPVTHIATRLTPARDGEAQPRAPYDPRLNLSFLQRGCVTGRRRIVREITFSKGVPIYKKLTFYLDARFVSYQLDEWPGEKDFLDTFVALHSRITDNSWVAIGYGLNPHSFDRWLYRLSNHGREDYLIDRGVFQAVGDGSELIRTLRDAEESLSDEWMITFEAAVRF